MGIETACDHFPRGDADLITPSRIRNRYQVCRPRLLHCIPIGPIAANQASAALEVFIAALPVLK